MGEHHRTSFAICCALFLLALIPCAIEVHQVVGYTKASENFLMNREIRDFSDQIAPNKTAFRFADLKHGTVVASNPLSVFSKEADSALNAKSKAWNCVVAAICVFCTIALFFGLMFTCFSCMDDKICWWIFGWFTWVGNVIASSCMAAGLVFAKNAEAKIIYVLGKTHTAPVSEVPHYANIVPWYVFIALLAVHTIAISFGHWCVKNVSFKRSRARTPALERQAEGKEMKEYPSHRTYQIDFAAIRKANQERRQKERFNISIHAHNAGYFLAQALLIQMAENGAYKLSDMQRTQTINQAYLKTIQDLREERLWPSDEYNADKVKNIVSQGFDKACKVWSKIDDEIDDEEETAQPSGSKQQGSETDCYYIGFDSGKSAADHAKARQTELTFNVRNAFISAGLKELRNKHGTLTLSMRTYFQQGFEDGFFDAAKGNSGNNNYAETVLSNATTLGIATSD